MSEQSRSFGLSFFSVVFVLGSIVEIFFWGSPTPFLFSKPDNIVTAYKYLLSDPPFQTLYLLYENTFSITYLFVGFGIWRLKPWSYRLLIVLLISEMLEKTVSLIWNVGILKSQAPMILMQGGIQIIVLALLLLFFRRQSIRDQFVEIVSLPALTPSPAPPAGQASSGAPQQNLHPLIKAKLREESQGRSVEAAEELTRLSGMENVAAWCLLLGGIWFSLRYRMGMVNGMLFGGMWGLESQLICFYIFRTRKLAASVGGGTSVLLSLIFSVLIKMPTPNPVLHGLGNFGANLISGFVGGKMVKTNPWFHGSSAGLIWALTQTGGLLYGRYGWPVALEDLDLLRDVSTFLGALVMGLAAAALGGFISGLKLGKGE